MRPWHDPAPPGEAGPGDQNGGWIWDGSWRSSSSGRDETTRGRPIAPPRTEYHLPSPSTDENNVPRTGGRAFDDGRGGPPAVELDGIVPVGIGLLQVVKRANGIGL